MPEDLTRSLKARDARVFSADSVYAALAMLIELSRATNECRTMPVLLLIEPDDHAEQCVELARATQLFVPTARIWRHAAGRSPALAAYVVRKEPTEAEQIAQARAAIRSDEDPYDRTRRESAQPSLRLVLDDEEEPKPVRGAAAAPADAETAPGAEQAAEDGLLTPDEIEMLMDPIFEPKPRRGGGSGDHR